MNENEKTSEGESGKGSLQIAQSGAKSVSVIGRLIVAEPPGRIPIAPMRQLFENAIKTTPKLKDLPLDSAEEDGKFVHYKNHETDAMWFGFAIGLRCAERLEEDGHLMADVARRGIAPIEQTTCSHEYINTRCVYCGHHRQLTKEQCALLVDAAMAPLSDDSAQPVKSVDSSKPEISYES